MKNVVHVGEMFKIGENNEKEELVYITLSAAVIDAIDKRPTFWLNCTFESSFNAA